jgi:hypothetical protein
MLVRRRTLYFQGMDATQHVICRIDCTENKGISGAIYTKCRKMLHIPGKQIAQNPNRFGELVTLSHSNLVATFQVR